MFYYCYVCKKDFCKECLNNREVHPNSHYYIKVNEKNNKCLNHYGEEVTQFCTDCEENICEKGREINHRGHNIINWYRFNNELLKYRKIIYEKNQNLSNIIRFNKMILNIFEKFKIN